MNITFIFGRCRCSSTAVTPGEYEYDVKKLTGILAGSQILVTEKLTNGALLTLTPHVMVSDVGYATTLRWFCLYLQHIVFYKTLFPESLGMNTFQWCYLIFSSKHI